MEPKLRVQPADIIKVLGTCKNERTAGFLTFKLSHMRSIATFIVCVAFFAMVLLFFYFIDRSHLTMHQKDVLLVILSVSVVFLIILRVTLKSMK